MNIGDHIPAEDLLRAQLISLLNQTGSCTTTAKILKVDRGTVHNWCAKWHIKKIFAIQEPDSPPRA